MWHNIFTFVWFTCTLSADMKNFITEKNNTTLWQRKIIQQILALKKKYGKQPIYYEETSMLYNPQIQISAESETKRSIFREKDKTKRSKKESAQHSKSRNKSFVMTSVSAL